MKRGLLVMVAAGAVLLAVGAGLFSSPDAGPPVAPAPPSPPTAVAPAAEWEAPEVPAAPAAAPEAAPVAVPSTPGDENMGLPHEEWSEGHDGVPEPTERQRAQLAQLRKEMPEFLELVDDAQLCDGVPEPMQEQLESLAGMVAEYAHEEDGGNAARGLSLMRAYRPRIDQYLRDGGCIAP